MSARHRCETQLISALINSLDPFQAQGMGITPDMFGQHQAEYRWLIEYSGAYRKAPSPEALLQKFPGFPYVADAQDVPFYCEELIYQHNHRRLTRTIKDAAQYLSEGDMEEAILTLGGYSPQSIAATLVNSLEKEAFLDSYHENIDVLKYPWQTLQEITGGHRVGELALIAARLGQGKSWSLASIVAQQLMDGRDVLFYSLEMSEEQVLTRMHVLLGALLGFDVDHIQMRNRQFDLIAYRKIVAAVRDQVPGKLYIQDTSKGMISPVTVAAQANRAELSVIDHVGLLHLPSGGRAIDDWRSMATISNQLKEVALSKSTRVLAAAQINREGESARDKNPPKIKHLAQSDALGQDADTIITHKRWGTAQVYSIEKNRDGFSDMKFYTCFEPNRGRFHQISKDEAEERLEDSKDDD